MISTGDFRSDIMLEIDDAVYQVIEFQHVKPGKDTAFVCTKIENVMTGAVTERTFRPAEKFLAARIDRIKMQYLYMDDNMYSFMNTEAYDQISLNKDLISDALKFAKENEMVEVVSYNGNMFSIEPPLFVELEATETRPDFAGNTTTGTQKPATIETGAQISMPLFIGIGDRVKIDTRTGEYLGRAQN